MSSSSTSSTSSLFTPLQFTGISQYSSDFQSILSRATSIAEIPVESMQNQVTDITQEETDLSSLGTAASAVQTALQTLGQLSTGGALSASSSDTSVLTATATGASAGTTYNITNVTSIASAASETSTTGYADASSTAVSSTGSMQLVVGSNTYNITLASGQNNLNGLVSAINNLGAGVTATVLTTGGTNGDYLSVTANSAGATTLKLTDDPTGTATDVLTDNNQGSNTNFDLNGVPISSASTTVNDVIPGLVLNFAGTTTSNETVTVGVSVNSSSISSALQTLVSSYNTLSSEETTEMGTGGGSLLGNNIVYQIRQAMSQIVDYEGDNSQGVGNLSGLGIEMDDTGQMSFNSQTFNALTTSQISSALNLLGTSTTGIGGLQQVFDQITNSTSGSIASQQSQWQTTVTNLSNQITTKTAQIQANEQTLDQQLQAADASVADLTTQQSELSAEITSLDYTSYGYNTNINNSMAT